MIDEAKQTSINLSMGPSFIRMEDVALEDFEEQGGQIAERVKDILREVAYREPEVLAPPAPRPAFWQRVWAVLNTDVRVLWAQWRGNGK